jgi:2,5-diketo-D-gluconate reductase A
VAPGVLLPCVCLGTFRARGEVAVEAMAAALLAGFRHIDTASTYKNYNEIRQALEASGVAREDIFITSKVSPYEQGTARASAAVGACLAGLGAHLCSTPFLTKVACLSSSMAMHVMRQTTYLAT